MANNEAYVSTGKPKVGGAVYAGATNLTLPTNATSDLPSGFTCLGYCSEDGLTNTTDQPAHQGEHVRCYARYLRQHHHDDPRYYLRFHRCQQRLVV